MRDALATAYAGSEALRRAQRGWLAFDAAEGGFVPMPGMRGNEGTSEALTLDDLALQRRRQRVCELERALARIKERGTAP